MKDPTLDELKELTERVSGDKKKSEERILWEIIQDRVDDELGRRFHVAVTGESQNTIKATLMAEEGVTNNATRTVSYRMGMVVNGKNLEAVMTIPIEAAVLDGRHSAMDVLRMSLAEQIAAMLMVGFQFPRGPRS